MHICNSDLTEAFASQLLNSFLLSPFAKFFHDLTLLQYSPPSISQRWPGLRICFFGVDQGNTIKGVGEKKIKAGRSFGLKSILGAYALLWEPTSALAGSD